MKRIFTQQEINTIVELRKQGKSLDYIAKQVGGVRRTISNYFKNNNIKLPSINNIVEIEVLENINNTHTDYYSFLKLTKQTKYNYKTVITQFYENGFKIKNYIPFKKITPEIENEILDLNLNHRKTLFDLEQIYKMDSINLIIHFNQIGKPLTKWSTKKIFTDEEKQFIIEQHKNNQPKSKICEYFCCDVSLIDKVAKELNLVFTNDRKLTQQEIDYFIEQNHNQKESLLKISKVLKISSNVLTEKLNNLGIEIKRHGRNVYISKDELNKVIELNQQGIELVDIAKELNISFETLKKNIELNNIKLIDNRCSNISDELFEQIRLENINGSTITEISKKYNFSSTSINKVFKEKGVRIVRYDRTLNYSPELMKNIIEDYTINKLNLDEISEKYDLNRGILTRNLNQHGVKTNNIAKYSEEDVKSIIIRYNNGESLDSIADTYNKWSGSISKVLKQNGIKVIDKKIIQFTDEELEDIKHKYVDLKYSSRIIGKVYNCDGPRIINRLKKMNVPIRVSDSAPERIIRNFCKLYIDNDTLGNLRNIIPPSEIDIYSPTYKIGIEYNGLVWHSDKYPKGQDPNYHLNKTTECSRLYIQLIQLFEDEFLKKETICFNYILSYFGINKVVAEDFLSYKLLDSEDVNELSTMLPALTDKIKVNNSDIKIKMVDSDKANWFIQTNSLYLENETETNFGYYLDEELIGLVSFVDNKLTHYVVDYKYQINNESVLLQQVVDTYLIETDLTNITASVDYRLYNKQNNIFGKSGFTFIKKTDPTMFVTSGRYRLNPEITDLEEYLLEVYPTKKFKTTELFDRLKEVHHYRIYDSGKIIYSYEKN